MNNKHLNNGNIWIRNFYLFGIPMFGIQIIVWYSDHQLNSRPEFKWWSEYLTNYKSLYLLTLEKVHEKHIRNLNTRLVRYSDPRCITKSKKSWTLCLTVMFLFIQERVQTYDGLLWNREQESHSQGIQVVGTWTGIDSSFINSSYKFLSKRSTSFTLKGDLTCIAAKCDKCYSIVTCRVL